MSHRPRLLEAENTRAFSDLTDAARARDSCPDEFPNLIDAHSSAHPALAVPIVCGR